MKELDLETYTQWLTEINLQPAWRGKADKEMDYYAGNQLNSEILARQAAVGIPPAIEPLIGPTIDAVLGMEVKNRLDWRVSAESGNDDVAQAMNIKLNKAEKKSGADAACSEAYASEISVGLGWVEVARNQNPFEFPYRCSFVHRNEIWWDWLAKRPDLSDARYLVRRKWMDRDTCALMFPPKAQIVKCAGSGWMGIEPGILMADGGTSTGLAMAQDEERGWSIEEMEWRDMQAKRVCLMEVWYQVWEQAMVIKTPDGRVVELDKKNLVHMSAIAEGHIQPVRAIISRMRLSWWLGPHKLYDGPTPYKHNKYPYVPFWGKREDRTGKPFGLIRGMMYLQDEVNARISKMQWGLAAVRTIRTQGAVLMDDRAFNAEIARPDADIILNAKAMRPEEGGVFKVERDFQLNEQQFRRLVDARDGIKRTGGIFNAFQGQEGQAKSGVAINSLVDQTTQTLADLGDNFNSGRMLVGELLLSLIVEDIGEGQHEVVVPATIANEEKVVQLNVPTGQDGILDNDIQRTLLKVELTDVPSTPTFRTQQLQTLGGAFESLPPQYQAIVLPYLLNLMDIPDKEEILQAVKDATQMPTPEDIQNKIKEAVDQALLAKHTEQKDRELDIKERVANQEIAVMLKEEIKKGVEAAFSAMQTGAIIMQNPAIAPVGDDVLDMAATYPGNPTSETVTPVPQGVIVPQQQGPESLPGPEQPAGPTSAQQPMAPGNGMAPDQPSPNIGVAQGMTTPDTGDNLGGPTA